MGFTDVMEHVARAFEVVAAAVLVVGLVWSVVAADLIRTVAVTPTLTSVAVLALIVLIRTVLSFSLELEIEGSLPWRRALLSGLRAGRAGRGAGPGAPDRDGE